MNNQDIAKKVIEALGGRENVNSVAHCATRLRVMVKDEGKINKEVIENLDKVQGAFFNSGQYQIIFGTGTVNKMYDEVVALGLPTSSKEDMKAEAAKQGNWFQRAIRTFGDVFVPIIPVIVATGLFMGLRGLMNALGMTLPEDVTIYSQILTDTAFIILPGLVVWSTFRVFGGNPAVGIVLGMMLVSGSLPNAWAVASGGEVVMAANEIGVPGSHNVENALATIAVAKLRGVDNQIIKETLSAFGGVKHRLQFVDEIKGIKFYNDSKSTNILATQKALSGFDNSKVILIAGGLDRGNEFDELVPDITGLKKMVILGQSAERVKRAADKAGVAYVDATDIADATRKAYELSTQGDVVLLSPANASWDMYANFEVRGDLFIDTVAELKE